jgi:hypothetical protein
MRGAALSICIAVIWAGVAIPCLIGQAAPAPVMTPAQQEHFLQTARIVAQRAVEEGVTHTFRITLTDGTTTHDAHVQTIDLFKPVYRTKEFVEHNFRDSYKYNIAAYRVAKMLKLEMTPTCVCREVDGRPASVCWWVDNVMFDELTRRERKIEPPDMEEWTRQMNLVRVFDQLIDNTDRNQGNLLIDKNWKVWMIDHSRAFRVTTVLRRPDVLRRVSISMMDGLRGLNPAQCSAALKPFLTDDEIRTMLVRRDLLIKFFESAASEKGPDAVYMDIPRHTIYATIP